MKAQLSKEEHLTALVKGEAVAPPPPQSKDEDQWALQYLNLLHLQPIMEAFDDDGTGFVSVMEVNTFTTSRPKDWRLE